MRKRNLLSIFRFISVNKDLRSLLHFTFCLHPVGVSSEMLNKPDCITNRFPASTNEKLKLCRLCFSLCSDVFVFSAEVLQRYL